MEEREREGEREEKESKKVTGEWGGGRRLSERVMQRVKVTDGNNFVSYY